MPKAPERSTVRSWLSVVPYCKRPRKRVLARWELGGGTLFSIKSDFRFVSFNDSQIDPPSMYSFVPTTAAIRTQLRESFLSFPLMKRWRERKEWEYVHLEKKSLQK